MGNKPQWSKLRFDATLSGGRTARSSDAFRIPVEELVLDPQLWQGYRDVLLSGVAVLLTMAVVWALIAGPSTGVGIREACLEVSSAAAAPGWMGTRVGSLNAPLSLRVFFDYTCPYSRQMQLEIQRLLGTLGDSITAVYHHFPLSDGLARDAALTAICAQRQGQFSAVHEALLGNTKALLAAGPTRIVEGLFPDRHAFQDCIGDSSTIGRLANEVQWAYTLGVRHSPSVLVGDCLLVGLVGAGEIEKTLKPERGRARWISGMVLGVQGLARRVGGLRS